MKKLGLLIGFGAFLTFASAAQAQVNVGELQDMAEEAINSDCAKKLAESGKDVGAAWGTMRNACADLRTCKKSCRKSKKAAKKAARAAKKDCKKACKSKKGKAKRSCKKSCRKEVKAAKKAARTAKKNCKSECRNEYKTPACKSGRKGFWKAIGKTVKNAGPSCVKDAKAFLEG